MTEANQNRNEKLKIVFQVLQLLLFLYLFLFSINLMGSALKLFGKGFAETLIANTSNPVIGLFIGIFATSLIQSSSSTTSIVVGMVGGGVLSVANAIPIVMGANIGTSVTNTLVSLVNINRPVEFKRSFAASTVHDFFNILAVIVIFPLQYFTNFLGAFSTQLAYLFQDAGGLKWFNPIKASTKPLINFLLDLVGNHPWILLILSLLILFIALKQIVSTLKVLLVQRTEAWFDKVLFKNSARAFLVGLFITLMAQSSSITTSLVVPMAGAGILTLVQIFPYTLGANIGTTITAILASLVTANVNAVVVAFAHLSFNISGIIVWWPLKKVPIMMAEKMSELAIRNKMIPFAYIIITFFIIPIIVFLFFK
jgi:solute carrier family 34 (sodium-dependent phosphate cotransporter)